MVDHRGNEINTGCGHPLRSKITHHDPSRNLYRARHAGLNASFSSKEIQANSTSFSVKDFTVKLGIGMEIVVGWPRKIIF